MKYMQKIKNFKWFSKFFNEPKLLRQSSKQYRGGVLLFGGLSVKPKCLQGRVLLRRNIISNSSFHEVCRYSQYVCRRKLCCAASLKSWEGPLKNLRISAPMGETLFSKICGRIYELRLLYIKYFNGKPEAVLSTTKLVRNLIWPPKNRPLSTGELLRERMLKEKYSTQRFESEKAVPLLAIAEYYSNTPKLRYTYSLRKNALSHTLKTWRKLFKRTKEVSRAHQKRRDILKERTSFPNPLKTTVPSLLPKIFSRPPLPRAPAKPIRKEKSFGTKNEPVPVDIPSHAGNKSIVVPINTVIRKQDRKDLIEFDRRIYKAYYANKENRNQQEQSAGEPSHLQVTVPTQGLSKDGAEMTIESLKGNMEVYFKDGKRVFTISKKSGSNRDTVGDPVVDIKIAGGKLTNTEYVPGAPMDFKANLVGSVSVKVGGGTGSKFFTPDLVKVKVDAFMNQVCQFLILSSIENVRNFHTENLDHPILTMSPAKDCKPCSAGKGAKSKSTEQKQPSSKSLCEQIIKKERDRESTEKSGCIKEQGKKAAQIGSENNAPKKEQCGGKDVRPKVSQCGLKGIQRALKQKPKDTRSCPDVRQVICQELRSGNKTDKKCNRSNSESVQKDSAPNGNDCTKPKSRAGERPKCATSPKQDGDKDTSNSDILQKIAKTIPTHKTTIKFAEPTEVRFEEVSIPPLRDNEVLIKMDTVGICLADIHMYETGISHYNGEEIPLGHEGSGTVIQVGSKVSHLKFGDRVAIEPSEACGRCLYCQSGRQNLCQETKFAGVMSNYSVHCENCCHKLPLGVTLEQGSLAYPLSLAIHACRLGCISLGSRVLVIGACPVGISAIMCARAMGAKDIAIVDSEEANLKIAKDIGANSTIQIDTNSETESLCQKLSCEMEVRPNIVVDSCGSTKSIDLSTNVIQPGGVSVIVGCQEENPKIPMLASLVKELVIKTSFRSFNTYPLALEMIRNGTANVEKLITHRFEFSKANEAFETSLNETKCKALKVVLKFPGK